MDFNNTEVFNIENAIRGMRNPLESWAKSDTGWYDDTEENQEKCEYKDFDFDFDNYKFKAIGPNDLNLARRLIAGGAPHCKFLRQIFVTVDITAPLYWWKEFDTYKIGTTANSTSTMHKLASTPITKDCFEMDDYEGHLLMYEREPYDLDAFTDDMWDSIINYCETLRRSYLETKDIKYWKELIRILPESWLQTRTVTMNYEVLRNICYWRKGHKLTEWKTFLDWAECLPYAEDFIFQSSTEQELKEDAEKFRSMMKEINALGPDGALWEDIDRIVEKYID